MQVGEAAGVDRVGGRSVLYHRPADPQLPQPGAGCVQPDQVQHAVRTFTVSKVSQAKQGKCELVVKRTIGETVGWLVGFGGWVVRGRYSKNNETVGRPFQFSQFIIV